MSRYEKIKEFIKDIFVPVILGICSIIVAICANVIANSSLEAAKMQALIAKNSQAPTIQVKHTPGSYQNDTGISISVLDGKYSNFKVETVSFFSFAFTSFDENDLPNPFKVTDIPFLYFRSAHGQDVMYGELWVWESDPDINVYMLRYNLHNYYMEKHSIDPENLFDIPITAVITCLKCSYLNLLGEEESVYYLIGPSGLIHQITCESGIEWFQKYKKMEEDGFFLYYDWQNRTDCEEAVFSLVDRINRDGKQYVREDKGNGWGYESFDYISENQDDLI